MKPVATLAVVTCPVPNAEARLRLFCFPFAGARASTFNSWLDKLPTALRLEIELCPIQLPGRETNRSELLFTRLSPLVEALVPAFGSNLDKPFLFFGHSMGALVSFELARQFRRHQLPGPVHLVVSGYPAPQLPSRHPNIHHLPDSEFLAKIRNLGGTPDAALDDSELMELCLPVLRADFETCETYTYADDEPLDCSITAFGGNDDRKVSREELSAWQEQTRRPFSLRMFPGDHFFLLSAHLPVLLALAQDLRLVLRRLTRPSDVQH